MMSRHAYDRMVGSLYRRAKAYEGPDAEVGRIFAEGIEILTRIALDIRHIMVAFHMGPDKADDALAVLPPSEVVGVPLMMGIMTARDKTNAARLIVAEWDAPLSTELGQEVIELGSAMMDPAETDDAARIAAEVDANLLAILDRNPQMNSDPWKPVKDLIVGARDALDDGLRDQKGGE